MGDRYQDEILGPLVRPYAGAVGPGFLLVHNNAQPHVARVCRQVLENEGIDTIDWPTGSPDLNPIEHLWDIMFRSIRRHQVALQTVQKLSDGLVQIWEEIPQDTIHRLIKSMWRPYKLLSTILSCCNGISVKWTSLLHHFFALIFRSALISHCTSAVFWRTGMPERRDKRALCPPPERGSAPLSSLLLSVFLSVQHQVHCHWGPQQQDSSVPRSTCSEDPVSDRPGTQAGRFCTTLLVFYYKDMLFVRTSLKKTSSEWQHMVLLQICKSPMQCVLMPRIP
ncbi:hypothetical protein NFI96_002430 [Prochilodus magdalenae]|nr:hypothetical protein NFI96_002430 [Prochilodus magdalenae]